MFFDIYRTLCDSKGISYKRAAMEIGLSNSVTAKWKNGATPNGSTLAKIADYFGVSIDYLLGTESTQTSAVLQDNTHIEITSDEIEMIRTYRAASKDARTVVDLTLKPFRTAGRIDGAI